MSGTLHVRWTISSPTYSIPKPILRCSRCDRPSSFGSTGKFRLNANGKRLDAWLIYRCADCGSAWNRAIFERRPRSAIAPQLLEALQCNDSELAATIAGDTVGLARWTSRFDAPGEATPFIEKQLVDGDPTRATAVRIGIECLAGSLRNDRLLAIGLGLSRSAVSKMIAAGHICQDGSNHRLPQLALRNMCISIDLCEHPAAAQIARAASGRGEAVRC
jgi:hypothetical protein